MSDGPDGPWDHRDLTRFIDQREARWIATLVRCGASERTAKFALEICKVGARTRGENPDVACERFVADVIASRSA